MLRILSLALVSASLVVVDPASNGNAAPMPVQSAVGVDSLLEAARVTPPVICALAARSTQNDWGFGADAPASPLASALTEDRMQLPRAPLTDRDRTLLLDAFGSASACERELAVRVIAQDRRESTMEALVQRLSAGSAEVRAASAMALGMLSRSVNASVPEALVRPLHDDSPAVRANAAWALGRMESGASLAALHEMLRDSHAMVRRAVVGAVGQIDSVSSAERLVRVLATDDAPAVRRTAAWALAEIGARSSAGALADALARDADPRVREMSAWALAELRARDHAEALRTALRSDRDERVRETAAWALAELDDRASHEALARALGDSSRRVRGTAAWALGELGGVARGTPAAATLASLLRDEHDDVRLRAAWALGEVRDPATVPALREALRVEQGATVRRAVLRALLYAGGQSEGIVAELVNDRDPRVRETAIRALAGRNALNPWPWPQPRPRPFP